MMGKGGVGKTTLSAATALAAAARGARVLVVSTDAAHSLGDALQCSLGDEPVVVGPGVEAAQLDGRQELEETWSTIAGYLHDLIGVAELARLNAEELLVIPGLEQLLALARLKSLIASNRWDAVVVDCAPSADSLRLFSLPEVLDWYASRIFGRDGTIRSRLRKTLERTLLVNAPDDRVIASTTTLSRDLADLRRVLGEANTTARVVVTPERLVVAEAQRTVSYLALYGYGVDAILVNRVVDDGHGVPWLSALHASQSAQLIRIDESFGPLTRLTCAFRPSEPSGGSELLDLGRDLYAGLDPLARLSDGPALEITSNGEGARLRLPVNGVDRDSISLRRRGTELVVTLGSHRRAVALPDGMRRQEVVRAGVVDGALEVDFAEAGHGHN
jgi:arsenite-transporting ATPase